MWGIEDYRTIVGNEIINTIYKKARRLYGKNILEVNSTYQGGGVAEMLKSFVHLMNDIGVETDWGILHGSPDFFEVTKRFHDALQGEKINLTEIKKKIYLQNNEEFYMYTHIHHDFVVVHDVQPLPLINFHKRREPWIWRCHVDISKPNKFLWAFVEPFILRYDAVIISSEKYRKKALPVDQKIVYPAIDPISSKNMDISNELIDKTLRKFGVRTDKPLLTQISRFDRWKDPEGLLAVYKLVKEKVDCRLVLCGSMATDDPEGLKVYDKVKKKASRLIENGDVLLLTTDNNILVNSLQRISAVVIQKSIKEGFGLTVAEALWKERPVVASNVGGIPLQLINGVNGYLVDPYDIKGTADKIVKLLRNPDIGKKFGKKGKEIVRKNFLITRLLLDYLDLLSQMPS
ncbi:MAG: glycosyltransferase [Candidatus Thermoplasmatota archaeon]